MTKSRSTFRTEGLHKKLESNNGKNSNHSSWYPFANQNSLHSSTINSSLDCSGLQRRRWAVFSGWRRKKIWMKTKQLIPSLFKFIVVYRSIIPRLMLSVSDHVLKGVERVGLEKLIAIGYGVDGILTWKRRNMRETLFVKHPI